MFVRWKKRKRFNRRKEPLADYIYAVLVESIRVDGKPRQKTIKYLGSIYSNCVHAPFRIRKFWVVIEKSLSELELSPAVRDKIISDIRKVVPLPTDDVVVKAHKESIEELEKLEKVISQR